jgi:hypothetical protein
MSDIVQYDNQLDSKAASTGNVQHFDTLLYNKAN